MDFFSPTTPSKGGVYWKRKREEDDPRTSKTALPQTSEVDQVAQKKFKENTPEKGTTSLSKLHFLALRSETQKKIFTSDGSVKEPDSSEKCASRLEEGQGSSSLQEVVRFLILEDTVEVTIDIQKTLLLNLESHYFSSLLTGPYKEGLSQSLPILIEDIDSKSFRRLKSWIEKPSSTHFNELGMGEILDFILKVHRFEIPPLFKDCDLALGKKIGGIKKFSEIFEIVEELTLLKRSIEYGDLFFLETIPSLQRRLSIFGLRLSGQEGENHHLFSSKRLNVQFTSKFLPKLKQFSFSLLKDAVHHLDLSLISNPEGYKEDLLEQLSNTESIHILIGRGKSEVCRDFLFGFKNLKKVIISFSKEFSIIHSLETFKVNFKEPFPWHLSFNNLHLFKPVETYEEEFLVKAEQGEEKGPKRFPEISIDHFIEFEILSGGHTSLFSEIEDENDFRKHNFYHFLKKSLTDLHIQKLIEKEKIDPKTAYLNLSGIPLSEESFLSLIKASPGLERLKLYPVPSMIFSVLPFIPSKLNEIDLPLSAVLRIFEDEGRDSPFFKNFIKDEKTTLRTYLDQNSFDFQVFQNFFKFLFDVSHNIRVEIIIINNDIRLTLEGGVASLESQGFNPQGHEMVAWIFKSSSAYFLPQLELKFYSKEILTRAIHFYSTVKSLRLKVELSSLLGEELNILAPIQALTFLEKLTLISPENENIDQWMAMIRMNQESLQSIDAEIFLEHSGNIFPFASIF